MVSAELVDEGLLLCRHVKPLHRLERELVRVILVKGWLQYSPVHACFLVVNPGDIPPKVQVLVRDGKDYFCDCEQAVFKVRIPGLVSCAHEACLWVAFKIGYFRNGER